MNTKNKQAAYLTIDMCLCLIILALITYIVSIFISNIHRQTIQMNVQNEMDHILRRELDYSVSFLRRTSTNLYLPENPSTYSKDGYTFEKKYTLLNDDFKLYKIDLSIKAHPSRYNLSTYFILEDK